MKQYFPVNRIAKPIVFVISALLILGTFFSTLAFAPSPQKAYAAPGDFVSTWDTTKISSGSSTDHQIKLPLYNGGTYDFVVDWGDLGPTSHITVWNQAETTHTYAATGIYTLTITGTCTGWRFAGTGDRLKISQISQWGNLRLGNNNGYFNGAANLKVTAVDVLDLTGTTIMSYAFMNSGIDTVPSMNSWDVSNVTNMLEMFDGAASFNQPIGSWDVGNVTNMSVMFRSSSFNQPIGNWDVGNVTTMSYMFWTTPFNQPIGNWNVSNVTNMYKMFQFASSFNQPLNNWDVSNVTNMRQMFGGASLFDQDISNWNVSNVTDMGTMFSSVTLSTTNYSNLLLGWSGLALKNNVVFSGGNSKYYMGAPATARATIIANFTWTITDGGSIVPAIIPLAPTVNATSTTSLTVIINTNGNADTAEYAISCDGDTTFLNYTSNACEAIIDDADHWRTYANWGGINGFTDTGLIANTQHTYKVKARDIEHTATVLSGSTAHYTLPNDPILASTACPTQTTYCLDTTPDITVTNASPMATYYYLVNRILAPAITDVEAGTADADGSFTVPAGQITPHATYYIHVISQNLDGDFSVSYGTYKVISRDSSGSPEEATSTPSTPPSTPTAEEIVEDIAQTIQEFVATPPSASFTPPVGQETGSTFTFDATSSTSNKAITEYYWDFGDGQTSDQARSGHQYKAPGRYTVTLTVTDRAGNKNTTTQTVDVKPAAPTITNMTAKDTALWIEGKADPGTTVYFTIHSNPFEGQGLANKDGYWTYFLDNASEILGAGDHTIVAKAVVKLADNTEFTGAESKTYDFKMSVDDGKLKVEMKKTKVWQITTGIFSLVIVLLLIAWAVRRKRSPRY